MQTSVLTPHKPAEKEHDSSTERPTKAEIEAAADTYSDSGRLVDVNQLSHIDGPRKKKLRLIECPACGKDLLPNGPSDLDGRSGIAAHLQKHLPQDFGLEPKRDEATLGGECNAD
jgi:hypothetical protein